MTDHRTKDPAYRLAHNPPGMTVFRPPATRMKSQKWLAEFGDTGLGPDGAYDTADAARAAAWVWHDTATRPDLTRTRAALAAYDAIDSEVTDTMTQAEATEFFKRLDAAKLAIGDAFALDTADRNDPEVVRSWASFNVERTRKLVADLTPVPNCPHCGTTDCGDCRNC